MIEVKGGCHCGAVRFSASVPAHVELLDCNCSICAASGYLHLTVPHTDFTLESGAESLTSYRFGSRAAEHLFCAICGVKSFYQPRSHPESWSINFNCLDQGHGVEATKRVFDGRNWEKSRAALG